jgi:hypothetical protein
VKHRRFVRLFVVAPWVCACYGYYPPAAPTPGVGTQVALTLNDAGSAEMARLVGPSAEVLEGRISSDSGSSVVLSMTRVRQHDGRETVWKGERIAVNKGLVSTMRERRFSRGRTTLAAVLASTGLGAAIAAFGGNGAGKLPANPGGSGSAK